MFVDYPGKYHYLKMYKVYKNIMPVIAAVIFMLSSTGFYLTVHHCNLENTTSLFLLTPPGEVPCEHHPENCKNHIGQNDEPGHNNHFNNNSLANTDCCSGALETAGCCSNNFLFIAVDNNFVKTDQAPPEIRCLLICQNYDHHNYDHDRNDANHIPGIQKAPPKKLHGKDLAFLNRVLIL